MNVGIDSMISNLGMSFTNIILLIVVVGSLIFMAIKFQLGAMMLFITTGVLFVIFYNAGYDYIPSLIVFFISLILMSLSLLSSSSGSGATV